MSSVFLLSSDYYDQSGHISVHDASISGLVFAKIPIEFLRKGGLDTWDFVLAITNMLVDPVAGSPGSISASNGEAIDVMSPPKEGHYIYTQDGSSPCPRIGLAQTTSVRIIDAYYILTWTRIYVTVETRKLKQGQLFELRGTLA